MPDSFEFPRVRRAVVPLVSAWNAIVLELVAHRFPRFTAVIRALDQLSEPAGGLGDIQPARVRGRPLKVINFPTCKMRTADVPLLTFSIGGQDERAFARANQYSYLAHRLLLFKLRPMPSSSNLGISGVESRSRHRRRTSARTSSRVLSIFVMSAQGAPVFSCRAAQINNSNNTGARSIPFSVSR